MPRGRIAITPERYQAFLDAFLHLGPNFPAVAKRVGCERETATRAWLEGWNGYAPIQAVYAEHSQRRGLALREDLAQRDVRSVSSTKDAPGQSVFSEGNDAVEALREEAITALKEEVVVLRRMRESVSRAFVSANRMLAGFDALSMAVATNMEMIAVNVASATPEALLNPLQKFATCIDLLATTQERIMKMQRLHVGAPQQITEQRGTTPPVPSDGSLERIGRVLELYKSHGLLPSAASPEQPSGYRGEESEPDRDPAASVPLPIEAADDA